MVGSLYVCVVSGSQLSCDVKASAQIERFRPFDPDRPFPSRDSARHHYVALPRENCSTTHRKRSRFQAGDPVKSLRSAQSSDRSRCRSGHPDNPPMLHIFCSCSLLMHEFKNVATWIGGLGSGPDQTLKQRALGAVEKDSVIGSYCGPGGAINRRMNKWPVSKFKRGVANDRFVGVWVRRAGQGLWLQAPPCRSLSRQKPVPRCGRSGYPAGRAARRPSSSRVRRASLGRRRRTRFCATGAAPAATSSAGTIPAIRRPGSGGRPAPG